MICPRCGADIALTHLDSGEDAEADEELENGRPRGLYLLGARHPIRKGRPEQGDQQEGPEEPDGVLLQAPPHSPQ